MPGANRPHHDPPLPLLITGVSGVAGYNALPYFQARYPGRVIGIRQHDNWRLGGPGIVACDAEDYEALSRLFDEHHFAAVLDCAGNCALRSCELDPEMAWRINVLGVENLLRVMSGRNARLVHLSIDLVFSGGGSGGHVEEDQTDPVTVYGKTMVAAEERIRLADPLAAILRISLPMGVSFNGHAGAIDWIQSRFKKSRPATLYFDEIRTPHYTDCLNELCAAVLASPLVGLVSCRRSAPPQPVSNRPDHQSRRRIRPRPVNGLSADQSRTGSSAGRECLARLEQTCDCTWL